MSTREALQEIMRLTQHDISDVETADTILGMIHAAASDALEKTPEKEEETHG